MKHSAPPDTGGAVSILSSGLVKPAVVLLVRSMKVRAAGDRKPFFLYTTAMGQVRGGSPTVKQASWSR